MKYNADLVYQVVRAKTLNKKRSIASTKDRGEVSGGGRKPWAQKGTGRARAGSIRSPLWKGGGITFGPRSERSYKKRIPEKMKKLAFAMVFEKKKEEKEVRIVDSMPAREPKTKIFNTWIRREIARATALVVLHENIDMIKRAGRNIPGIKITDAANVEILDLLRYKYLVLTKEAEKKLKERIRIKSKIQSSNN